MASGCVVVYEGKRGCVYRIKLTDNTGQQHMETLGPEKAGSEVIWTRRKAEKALRDRLADVEAKRRRRASPLTLDQYASTWLEQGGTRRAWKPRTAVAYTTVTDRLTNAFRGTRLADLRPGDVASYIERQTKAGFAPATVNRDVSILHDILKVAVREELIDSNPAAGAERLRIRQKRWRILQPAEVALVARSFTDEQARAVFLVLVLCGLGCHELRGLRWKDVDLVENVLTTKRYMHLAGVVFRDEAERLEQRYGLGLLPSRLPNWQPRSVASCHEPSRRRVPVTLVLVSGEPALLESTALPGRLGRSFSLAFLPRGPRARASAFSASGEAPAADRGGGQGSRGVRGRVTGSRAAPGASLGVVNVMQALEG